MMQWIGVGNKHNWIFSFILGTGAGILFRSFFIPGIPFVLVLLLIAMVLILMYAQSRRFLFFTAAFILLGFCLGFVRMELAVLDHADPLLKEVVGEMVSVRGRVVFEPDIRDDRMLVPVALETLGNALVDDTVLVTVDPNIDLLYGDRIMLSGKLLLPENFETESGNVFNYVAYLEKDDIHFRMYYPEVVSLERGKGNPVIQILLLVKQRFLFELSAVIPEPQVSLLGGLLLGAKQSLGEELLDAFRVTGIIHIVVLSGYNITKNSRQ